MNSRACGFVFCYNEEHILRETLLHYLEQGIDLVVVDNCSTDGSMAIARELVGQEQAHPGRIRDIIQVETEGYEWQKILRTACEYMHRNLSEYTWILLIDADSFYRSPVKDMSLLDFLEEVRWRGYNVVDGALYEFYPTEKDDPSIASHTQRLKYCKVYQPYPQHKIFQYHPSIDFYTHFGHICLREDAHVSCVQFLYLHYKWVSYDHGIKKLFTERLPRYVERREHARYHPQYLGLLPLKEDLIKPSESLWRFQEEEVLMSQARLQFMMMMGPGFDLVRQGRGLLRRELKGATKALKDFGTVLRFSPALAARLVGNKLHEWTAEEPAPSWEQAPAQAGAGSQFFEKPLAERNFWVVTPAECIEQKPYADGLPQAYHFLMTDFCNAGCIFCNQDFTSTKQISLQDFKTMISHVPSTRGSNFVLSGGGEPLLCRDLFRIIQFVNEEHPWVPITIKSNGLLVGKFAEQIAKARISRFGISVHGATRESNNAVLRANNGEIDVFEGLGILNEHLDRERNPMRKLFYIVVSKANIDEVPALVRRAAECRVDEVMVMFSKQFPAEVYETGRGPPAKDEDSLFFHQEKYNEVILEAQRLARSLGVAFRHEPLFNKRFKEQPCFQPWNTIVVNWDGTIFPCTGGEVWFRKSVKEGEYRFGNLLKEHMTDFWNNESYTKIRRTTSRNIQEELVPECRNCHNTCCFKGPNLKRAHILKLESRPKQGPLRTATAAQPPRG